MYEKINPSKNLKRKFAQNIQIQFHVIVKKKTIPPLIQFSFRTEYDNKCETKYEEKCETVYDTVNEQVNCYCAKKFVQFRVGIM